MKGHFSEKLTLSVLFLSFSIKQSVVTVSLTQSKEALPLDSFLGVCLVGIIPSALTFLAVELQWGHISGPVCVFSPTIENTPLL